MGSVPDAKRMLGDESLNHRDRFAGIRQVLTTGVESSLSLMEELLQELDTTKAFLREVQLDFENERDGRLRLQKQIQNDQSLAEARGRRPFVVALIDADHDCYFFKDEYLEKGSKGGELAADALYAELQEFCRAQPGVPHDVDIMVKAFAKMNGLETALQKAGKLRAQDTLRAFAGGFSRRKPFFDFVDVGQLKEGADVKFKANAEFFLESFQCKHLVLGCVHDEGYVSWLQRFVGDAHLASRMTLIEGDTFLPKMRELNLNSITFDTVFQSTPKTTVKPSFAAAVAGSAASVMKYPTPTIDANGVAHLTVQSHRLGIPVYGVDGRRVDWSPKVNKAVADRIAREQLCYWLYLRGRCEIIGKETHNRNHLHRALTNEEYDALLEQSRVAKCYKSLKPIKKGSEDCIDPLCVYGHQK